MQMYRTFLCSYFLCSCYTGLSYVAIAEFSSVQFSSVTQSCLTLCDSMNRSTPGLHTTSSSQLVMVDSITNSWSPPKPMSIESVMPSSHFFLCSPLLILPSVFPSIRVFLILIAELNRVIFVTALCLEYTKISVIGN